MASSSRRAVSRLLLRYSKDGNLSHVQSVGENPSLRHESGRSFLTSSLQNQWIRNKKSRDGRQLEQLINKKPAMAGQHGSMYEKRRAASQPAAQQTVETKVSEPSALPLTYIDEVGAPYEDHPKAIKLITQPMS